MRYKGSLFKNTSAPAQLGFFLYETKSRGAEHGIALEFRGVFLYLSRWVQVIVGILFTRVLRGRRKENMTKPQALLHVSKLIVSVFEFTVSTI